MSQKTDRPSETEDLPEIALFAFMNFQISRDACLHRHVRSIEMAWLILRLRQTMSLFRPRNDNFFRIEVVLIR